MLIDIILDRKDGKPYNPRQFYNDIMAHYQSFPDIVCPVANAMDGGEEQDVKTELTNYIIKQEYSPAIINYIYSVNWL